MGLKEGPWNRPWGPHLRYLLAGIVVLICAVLYLGGYTRLFRGDELPAGELLMVTTSAGSVTSVDLEVHLDYAEGIPASVAVETRCQPSDEVQITVTGTREPTVEQSSQCPSSGVLKQDLELQLSEENTLASLDGGREIFDLQVQIPAAMPQETDIRVSAAVSWSAYFDQVYGGGQAGEPRRASWSGRGDVHASGVISELVLGGFSTRLNDVLLLLIGALAGFATTLGTRSAINGDTTGQPQVSFVAPNAGGVFSTQTDTPPQRESTSHFRPAKTADAVSVGLGLLLVGCVRWIVHWRRGDQR